MCDSGITTVRMIYICILMLSYGAMVDSKRNISGIFGTIVDATNKTMGEVVRPIANEISPYVKHLIRSQLYFILYDKQHSKGIRFMIANYTKVHLNINRATKLLIHGWRSNGSSPMPTRLKNEYFKLKLYNIIVLDWGNVAQQSYMYPIAANGSSVVGEYVADFLLKLYENSISKYINVHLVGFSLGAHVAGFAGRKLTQKGFIVSRITALDPADVLVSNGIDADNGAFVDVIHTSGGILGKREVLGHADFYPNGGVVPQPHCGTSIICSHARAWQYFAKTINNPQNYLAHRCKSYNGYLSGSYCDDSAYMGEGLSNQARGVYYLIADDIH